MKKLCLSLILAALPLLARSQSKLNASAAIWPELQVSYGVGEDGILFFQNQYRINTDTRFNDLSATGVLQNFERVQLALGYEHTLTAHWRGGLLLRYAMENFPKISFTSAFLRHNGSIGGLYFNKQAMFEYVLQEEQSAFGRARFAAELGKRIAINGKFITPALSYEAFVIANLQRQDDDAKERAVDRTRLKLRLTYEQSGKLRIAPYFMRQTDYYYVLIPPKYNENNQLVAHGYTSKRNRITPIVGLVLQYHVNTAPNTASIVY